MLFTKAIIYNYVNLSKNIIKGAVQQSASSKVERVDVSDTITYSICFDNKDNDYRVTNMSIVDILWDEVSFVTKTTY